MRVPSFAFFASALLASVAVAQTNGASTGTSQPNPLPIVDTVPQPRDIAYPGTIKLAVDATDIAHRIFRIEEQIPVKAGQLVLLYPAWLPGAHAPQGRSTRLPA